MTIARLPVTVALLALLSAATARADAPDAVFEQIAAAISKGDASALSPKFAEKLEVNLPGSDGTYSAEQAAMLMKDFFAKNSAKSFAISNKGSPPSGGTWYAKGVYSAATGNFNATLFVKKIGEKFQITQIRFEPE